VTAIFFIGENLPNIEDYLVLLAKTLKMIWFLLTYFFFFFFWGIFNFARISKVGCSLSILAKWTWQTRCKIPKQIGTP